MDKPVIIYKKLANIRKLVEVLQKDAKAYGYYYVKEEDLLAKITVGMDSNEVSIQVRIVPGTFCVTPYSYKKTKLAKNGQAYDEVVNEVIVSAELVYSWIDNETGERIEIPWAMVGQQADASQAFGSGLTYANRYFLLKHFQVATSNDDPDEWRSKQKEAEDEQNAMVCQAIIEQIDAVVQAYLAAHKDDRKSVVAFFSEYVDKGNYKKIADPVLAARVLENFQKKFSMEVK